MILLICAVVGDSSEIVGALYVVVHEKQIPYASKLVFCISLK